MGGQFSRASLVGLVSVPWNAFVAAFLYYTVLALVLVGGGDPSPEMVTGAYAAPPAMYAATVATRFVRAALVAFAVTAIKRPGVLPVDVGSAVTS